MAINGEVRGGQRRRVAVVGAGIAGLTAAYELQKAGCEVTVLEVKDIPGGRMAEKLEGSFMKYTGATGLFRFYKDMWELIAELGLSERLMLYPKMGSGIASNTKETYELDFNQTFGMLKHPALSAASRLRLASLIPDFLRARSSVDPCLIHTAAAFDDESMTEYLTRKVGVDFLENVVAIVYRNLWAWNVEQASKAYFLMIYPHVRNRPSYTFTTGFGTLTGALAGKLNVRFNTKVEKIELGDDCEGRSVICEGPQGRYKLDADIVVCARGLRATRQQGCRRRRRSDAVGKSVLRRRALCAIRDGSFCAQTQAGAGIRHPHLPYARAPHADLVHQDISGFGTNRRPAAPVDGARAGPAAALSRWRRIQSRSRGAPLGQAVLSLLGAGPQGSARDAQGYIIASFPPGQARKVRSLLSTQEAGPKNIYYVGDYLGNATTGGALAIGRRTARKIVEHWVH
jgi:oxygen-dependent protoporphyrinogen oxidase